MNTTSDGKRFSIFLIVGAFAALANISSRYFFNLFFSFELSVLLAFFVGLTTGFLLMRKYAFERSDSPILIEFLRFSAVNLIALGLTFSISLLSLRIINTYFKDGDMTRLAAHTLGVGAPVALSTFCTSGSPFDLDNRIETGG